jgi:hypothetical protein
MTKNIANQTVDEVCCLVFVLVVNIGRTCIPVALGIAGYGAKVNLEPDGVLSLN